MALKTFGELPIVFSTKVYLLYLLYSTAWMCCLLHLLKQNCLLKTFLKTLILMTQAPVFPSITNLKLHNISVTPKMAKNFITNLDLSKASGPDCIPVVVLKNCEPELCYILILQILGRFHWWSLYLRMLGKGLQLRTTTLLFFFLWLVKSLKTCTIVQKGVPAPPPPPPFLRHPTLNPVPPPLFLNVCFLSPLFHSTPF